MAAQARACPEATDAVSAPAQWIAPLDRFVTAHASGISLRDALARVISITKIRLSYSTESVPLNRSVCLSADRTPVGQVLGDLLAGTNLSAVAIGSDQVVLAPSTASAERQTAPQPEMAPSMSVLDKMVVTSNAIGSSSRDATVASDVLDGRQLARDNANNLSSFLDGYVPGVWSWTQSPANLAASYASIRGASSFGLSYPKIYVDGIEVANPLLVTRFATDAIERVEVIRGPQGSALYGTDAISGVVNIVTRHEGANADGEHAMLRGSAGLVQTDFGRGVVAQNHSLSLVSGSPTRSADLHVSASTVGDFIPNGYSRDLVATGGARVIREHSTFSATARFFTQQAGAGTSPLLSQTRFDTASKPFTPQSNAPQSIREYTLGGNASFAPNDRWTHTIVAGVDGYSLANVQTNATPITSVTDSALRAAQGGAARGTVRASSTLRLGETDATKTTLTFSAEQGLLRATSTTYEMSESPILGAAPRLQSADVVSWQNNTALTSQASASLDNTWFASGGVRLERDSRLPGGQIAALPMLGLAAVRDYAGWTVKLRGAYGEGIRPASALGRSTMPQNAFNVTQPALGAERQAGTEAGLDIAFRQLMSLRVTRFDQRASGLIQQVVLPADDNPLSRRMRLELENVGEIANSGWEMEAAAKLRRLSVTGTLSFVDSRVKKLAQGYNGDLMTGDRMLQVPAKTGAVNLTYTGRRWFATLGGSRALDWINYDELALSQAYLSDTHSMHELVGQQLRSYWRRYNGGLRVRASFSRDFRDLFSFEVSGENLLNYQQNEPDNLTIVPGRTLMTGLRVKF